MYANYLAPTVMMISRIQHLGKLVKTDSLDKIVLLDEKCNIQHNKTDPAEPIIYILQCGYKCAVLC